MIAVRNGFFLFFFFSHVHNYYPVRERSCICVKINFLSYFKLSSLAAMAALHNEPFIFWYPEGGSSTNIFNCPFCVSQRWDSQYEKCPECLIALNSFSHINFYRTISDGTLPFPRCTHILCICSQYLNHHTRISRMGTWTYYLMPVKHQAIFGYNILWLTNVLFVCFKRPLGKCLSYAFRSMSCFHLQL